MHKVTPNKDNRIILLGARIVNPPYWDCTVLRLRKIQVFSLSLLYSFCVFEHRPRQTVRTIRLDLQQSLVSFGGWRYSFEFHLLPMPKWLDTNLRALTSGRFLLTGGLLVLASRALLRAISRDLLGIIEMFFRLSTLFCVLTENNFLACFHIVSIWCCLSRRYFPITLVSEWVL